MTRTIEQDRMCDQAELAGVLASTLAARGMHGHDLADHLGIQCRAISLLLLCREALTDNDRAKVMAWIVKP